MSMPVISALDFTGANMVDETIPEDTPMKNFYRNKTIFITGGTGFLGQIFIEKLLRCKAKVIYVLARPKKNKTSLERIHECFVGALFAKLEAIDPNYMNRIHLIEGDTNKSDLGISNDHRKEIIDNVEIVLHAAAEVRFDKSLEELCFTNVRGTKALIALTEEIKNLIVFAYVSTAFSQYHQKCTEEKFYPPPLDPDQMIRIAEHFAESQSNELEVLTDKLIEPWQNTYVFTKSLSEELVRRTVKRLPTVVVRPSIVISTFEDPIPAWSNNLYGINGMAVASGLGFIRVAPNRYDIKNNVVCADFVTNGTLALIWDKANERSSSTKPIDVNETDVIYHITAEDTTTYGLYYEVLVESFYKFPSTKTLWVPSLIFCDSKFLFYIMSILYHVIPAFFFDSYFILTNSEIRLLPIYRKSQDFLYRVSYFCSRDWNFIDNNMKAVIKKMSEDDKKFFLCDQSKFSLLDYCYSYMLGIRLYIGKDPLDNLDVAKKRFRMLRIASYIVSVLFYSFVGCMIYLLLCRSGYIHYLQIAYDQLLLMLM